MKKIIFSILMVATLSAYGEDFVLCYLHRTVINKDGYSNSWNVPGSYALFDKDHYDLLFFKTVDGVRFRLMADSEAYVEGLENGYLYAQAAGEKGWDEVGKIKIEDLFDWTGEPYAETDSYELVAPSADGNSKGAISIKAKCERIPEREAIIRIFNSIHTQSEHAESPEYWYIPKVFRYEAL